MAIWTVKCTEKHPGHGRIIAIGCVGDDTGNQQRFTEDEAINRIEKKTDEFYDERPKGHRVRVVVAEREGCKYLKTEPDGEKPNNLDSLPACPGKAPTGTGGGTIRTVAAAVGSHCALPPAGRL